MTDHRTVARRVLDIEISALRMLTESLDLVFDEVVERLNTVEGRIILAGVGKSGHVARKIAATLSSTGSPSLYIHPTEASHGDMGMIGKSDAVIALSRSGETTELANLMQYCQRFSIPLIAMTAAPESTLARNADYCLILPHAPEACAETNAPTTSTTLQIAMGDALAVALLEAKGFTAKDFKAFHPGGALGASLRTVGDLMHGPDHLPLALPETTLNKALDIMSDKGFGCVGIWDGEALLGLITDGDIRRYLLQSEPGKLSRKPITDIMTQNPKSATPDQLAASALRLMTETPPKIMQMFVLEGRKPVGIIHMHDFLRAGLI